ncbi:MAG: peptide deformylase [Clostridiales bacterium]|nr:peptide deformylase [Clostridiales bacterium]
MKIAVTSKKNDISKTIKNPLQLEIYPGSQVLRQVACPVEVFGNDIQLLASWMLDFMRKNNGIGLAAPQIGLLHRIIVVELNSQNYCIVNPEVCLASDWDIMQEGCLSLPGRTVNVRRHRLVQIQGQDTTGKPKSLLASGLLARVFQHEIDHLNGIMICDYETQG